MRMKIQDWQIELAEDGKAKQRVKAVGWAMVFGSLLKNCTKSKFNYKMILYEQKINETMNTAMKVI